MNNSGLAVALVTLLGFSLGTEELFAQSAVTEITVNLASRSFTTTLPFDEEFTIKGTTSTAVRLIQVFYFDDTRNSPPTPPSCPSVGGDDNWQNGPYEYVNPGGSTAFDVRVTDALEAEHSYSFRFCAVGIPAPAVLTEFQARATGLIDAAIRKINIQKIEPTREGLSIRNQLCELLSTLLDAQQIIAPDSLFDCGRTDIARLEQFTAVLADVLTPQYQATQALEPNARARRVADLMAALTNLRDHTALDAFIAALQQAKSPALQAIAQQQADVFALAAMDDAQIRLRAEGRGPSVAVAAPMEAYRAPGIAADVGRNYRQTLTALQMLHSTIRSQIGDDETLKRLQSGLSNPLPLEVVSSLRALAPDLTVAPAADPCTAGAVQPLVCGLASAPGLATTHDVAAAALTQRAEALQRVTGLITLETAAVTVVRASTIASVDTNRTNYVSADAGFLTMPGQGTATAYIASNIYFRPINPRASLAQYGGWGRRLAMTVGLTINSIADSEQTRFDLFNSQSLVLGLGMRATEVLRVSAGVVGFLKADPNPFVTRRTFAVTPYVSFSVDLNLAIGAAGFGDLFKKKQG